MGISHRRYSEIGLFDRAWFDRLNLSYCEALSNFAFNFNMRRYNELWRGSDMDVQQIDAVFYGIDEDNSGRINFEVGPGGCREEHVIAMYFEPSFVEFNIIL